ncbi:MAG: hypothetical protein ACJART_000781 [Maribacter sp.]|jgi:hypothetical protein|tara:strand:+ start:327 stop:752 length:426 start_codon:yes stop_codon:yes gene_type:complete
MVKTLLLIFIFSPLILLGQDLKSCESTEGAESYLRGIWKVKNKNANTRYEYSFEDGQGHWTQMESAENKDDHFIGEIKPFVYTITSAQGFELKMNHSYGNWFGEFKFLNARKMVLVSNGKETKFIKKNEINKMGKGVFKMG